MVTLDWETDRTDGVTLVRLYVTAEDRRRVRIENRLDGPVWPPREEGQPAAGWDDDTFEGVVAPDHRLVAGYATPAQPADPPAEVVTDEPAGAETPVGPDRRRGQRERWDGYVRQTEQRRCGGNRARNRGVE